MAGVGLMVRVVGLVSWDPELKSPSVVELIPGGVDSVCHPSEVGKMSTSMLVYCVGVATRPGLCHKFTMAIIRGWTLIQTRYSSFVFLINRLLFEGKSLIS